MSYLSDLQSEVRQISCPLPFFSNFQSNCHLTCRKILINNTTYMTFSSIFSGTRKKTFSLPCDLFIPQTHPYFYLSHNGIKHSTGTFFTFLYPICVITLFPIRIPTWSLYLTLTSFDPFTS